MKDSSSATLLVVFFVSLAISGTFSLIETALLTFNRSRMKHLQESGEPKAGLLIGLTERVDKLLATILLCNNLANVVVATVATILAVRWFGDEEHIIVATSLAVTAMILVFSEITPKAIGVRHAEQASLLVARPLGGLIRLLTPFVYIVELTVKVLIRMTGTATGSPFKGSLFGFAELRSMVKDAENLGGAEDTHRELLVNVIDIKDMSVEHVMVPKKDIMAVNLSDTPGQILARLREAPFTNVPVYREQPDNITGIVSTREILAHALGGGKTDGATLARLGRPPLFVPASTSVLRLLRVFQERRHNFGIVVNEYGEVIGLVSGTDLLTEIAGAEYHEIPTTHSHSLHRTDSDGNVIVDGGAQIREINRRFSLRLPLDGPKTLNGLMHALIEDFPDAPCCVEVADTRMELIVNGDDPSRTLKVKILRPPAARGTAARAKD